LKFDKNGQKMATDTLTLTFWNSSECVKKSEMREEEEDFGVDWPI
jgi:hypothetical protein